MLFLSEEERAGIRAALGKDRLLTDLYWRLYNRAKACASRPGIVEMTDTSDWWYGCFDYLSVAALFCALKPDDELRAYVRDATLALARRPMADWVGPWFRNHNTPEPVAHLETAHLSWAVSAALDLAGECFTAEERAELLECLRTRAIPLCRRALEGMEWLNNWHAILTGGLAMAAAVAGEREPLEFAAQRYRFSCELFQPDGSYCESLQYSNYAQVGLTLTYESLVRARPELADTLQPERYGKGVRWAAASLLYFAPQEGWEAQPRARSANFNDSAALFQPTGDVLLHIASRCREKCPAEAALARRLFEDCYAGATASGPLDLASFGFNNTTGFLTLQLLTTAAAAHPQSRACGVAEYFACGDSLLRDQPAGQEVRTILAVHGGGDVRHVASHAHADLGSFVLAHNNERLLIDPGHSCYRGSIHREEIRTRSHNACTFLVRAETGYEKEEEQQLYNQRRAAPRTASGELFPPSPGTTRHLLTADCGNVRCTGYELTAAYGELLESYRRFWLLDASGALFVVDQIRARREVRPVWNWALNNHGGILEFKPLPPDRVVARRSNAGLKMFHLAGGRFSGPEYGFAHDSYHPLPAQRGEGKSGSAWHIRWTLPEATRECCALHALAMDSYGMLAGWHLKEGAADRAVLESPGKESYALTIPASGEFRLQTPGGEYRLSGNNNEAWQLRKI